MRIFILIRVLLLTLFIMGCSIFSYKKSNLYQVSVKNIPNIYLPLEIMCTKNLPATKIQLSQIIGKNIYNNYVFGKFFINDTILAIIFMAIADEDIPIIKTFDINGNIIDSLTLLKNCGANDGCYYANSYAEIKPDFSAIIIDTIRTCELDSLDNIIINSERIEINISEYIINQNGKILKIFENHILK